MITLVRVSAQAIAGGLHPSDADVQKMFDAAKGRLSIPETRSFVQIPAKDPGQAQAIAARLSKARTPPPSPGHMAASRSAMPTRPRPTISDQSVAKAVFALKPGQVSGPIQGQFGLAVAKLIGVTPAKPATLERARPQIEKNLTTKAAKDVAYDQSEKYSTPTTRGRTWTRL